MALHVIIPSDPKDPSAIYTKYKVKEENTSDLEGILVLCFLTFFLGIIFKIIEIPCVAILILLSTYLTAKNGEINIVSSLPLIMMLLITTIMTWFQQKAYINKQTQNLQNS